jgi:hypothetical protein
MYRKHTTHRSHRRHSVWVEIVGGVIAAILAIAVGFSASDDDDDYDDDRETSQYEEYDD